MLRLGAKLGEIWGFSLLVFVKKQFQESGIAALHLGLKPRHVKKFRECRLTDVGESELADKKKKHAQNTRSNKGTK